MLDILLKGGTIVNGLKEAPYKADIAIKDGYIKAIGEKIEESAQTVIDAAGFIVAPGFIDIHSHSDMCHFIPSLKAQSKLYQGITLEIVGNCGTSNLPVSDENRERLTKFFDVSQQMPLGDTILEDDSVTDYAKHMERLPAATNVGVLIGHGTLRVSVIGMDMRKPTLEEQKRMEELLEKEMQRGAFGLSLGLAYPPGSFADFDELVGLAKIVAKYNGILAVHMRSESANVFQAVEEMLSVTRASGVHLEISHLKLMGKSQWGKSEALLKLIRDAQKEGLNVTSDQYPYTATSTGLSVLVPKWAADGGFEKMCTRLESASEKLKTEISEEMERRGGPGSVLILSTHERGREYEGKRISEIAEELGCSAVDAVIKILIQTTGATKCCYFSLSEADVETIMKEDFVAVGSDGYAVTYDKGFFKNNMHPRCYGTYPKFFEMVREKSLMKLEEAVYKTAALPAQILGLKDRGTLEIGKIADLTIFDYANIKNMSDYINSAVKPKGIKTVIISGKIALDNGEQVGPNRGHVVLHQV